MYIHIYVYVYIYIYVNIYIYICIHTHTQTCTCACAKFSMGVRQKLRMSAKVTECTRAARPHVCDSLWFVLHQDALVGYGQCMQSVSVDGIGMPTSMSRAFQCLCLKEAPSPYKEAPSRYPN